MTETRKLRLPCIAHLRTTVFIEFLNSVAGERWKGGDNEPPLLTSKIVPTQVFNSFFCLRRAIKHHNCRFSFNKYIKHSNKTLQEESQLDLLSSLFYLFRNIEHYNENSSLPTNEPEGSVCEGPDGQSVRERSQFLTCVSLLVSVVLLLALFFLFCITWMSSSICRFLSLW